MHETEKWKINLIYNHNFTQSFILLCKKIIEVRTILRASKGELQEKVKGARLKTTLLPKRLIRILPTLPY